MKIIPQSDEAAWKAARIGKVTASRIVDVMAQGRGKNTESATRNNYLAELVAERLTGRAHEGYSSSLMERGKEVEEQARNAYAFMHDIKLLPGGFVLHPSIANAGASPDVFVGDDGMAEFKCPITKTHIDTLLGKAVPRPYALQMQWQLACTGRAWCDYTSFDPYMPEDLQLLTYRIERDDHLIRTIEFEVCQFLSEVDERIALIRDKQSRT